MADVADRLNIALAGRYAIQRELGAGGMATVFLARDLRHPRLVAIKVLHPELSAALGPERFLREIATASALNHPHILPLYDSGATDGLLFYVMPYAEGESLRHRLESEKQLPISEAVRIAREIADALDYAHRHGVVHRDIKPENILLHDRHAFVADFGIARAVVAAGGQTLTATGIVLGTPAYMSPEQLSGGQDLDGRTDQYSLGCVVYEMLAGQAPFIGPTAESLAHQHLSVMPRPVTQLRTSVPVTLERALSKTLAKTAADRFVSAAEFAAAIETTGGVITPMTPATTAAQERPRAPAGRPALTLIGSLALAVMALVAFAAWQGWGPFRRKAEEKEKAWILVAEFEGPHDDPALALGARDLVSAGLDQSGIVTTVPRSELKAGLTRAGKPDTTRVDAGLARELAMRGSIRTVVEGVVAQLGSGYTITVRVVEAETGRLVLAASEIAGDRNALIRTVERVTRRVRAGLGERAEQVRATQPLVQIWTPSFEAFQLQMRGIALTQKGDAPGALAAARSALALDPEFAAARAVMGYAYAQRGQVDSAVAAFRGALSRPDRISERSRFAAQAEIANMEGDFPLAVATLDQLIQREPNAVTAYSNLGYLLYKIGQYERSLSILNQAMEVSPFGPVNILLLNRFYTLMALGRREEAAAVARELSGDAARSAPLMLAAAGERWAVLDSLGTALETDASASRELRRLGALAVASAEAARGAIASSERAIGRAEQWVGATSLPAARIAVQAAPRARLLLSMVCERPVTVPQGEWASDTTTSGLLTRALYDAAGGDTALARRRLAIVRNRPARVIAREGAAPLLVEALLASRAGDWSRAIRVLGPAARAGSEPGLGEDQAGRVTLRWIMANAYERMGRPDSAAAYLELALSPLGRVDQEYLSRGIVFPFAHHRLAILYARLGRLEDARRHSRILAETLTRPDPEMTHLLEDVRAALAAQGAATSAAR